MESSIGIFSQSDQPYYVAQLNDEGILEQFDPTKLNTQVRFLVRQGSQCSYNAVLLINLPQQDMDGSFKYTMTQPRENWQDNLEEEENYVYDEKMKGSELDTQYLEVVEPLSRDGAHLEFLVDFKHTGSFFIQLQYVDWTTKMKCFTTPQFINVEPVLELMGQKTRVKQLSIMTVLSKCLGPLNSWDNILENVAQLGYNAIHYVPIQLYGQSQSHYSIKDQTTIDDFYFGLDAARLNREERMERLENKLLQLKSEQGLLGIVDIVLNHTANNSEWILEHPDATYNTDNCPHLYSAWVLDDALYQLGQRFARKEVPRCPSAPYINNEQDLNKVMEEIRQDTIPKLKIHEYFMFNIEQNAQDMKSVLTNPNQSLSEQMKRKLERIKAFGKDKLKLIKEELSEGLGGPKRMGVKLSQLAIYLIFFSNNQNVDQSVREARDLMQKMNNEWGAQIQNYMNDACNAIHGTMKYHILELKKNHIKESLIARYFTELKNSQKSKVVHNGWIMNHDLKKDFVLTDWHYLRRNINIWEDCIKLRYGSCPADSPYLWKHMSLYVSEMARVFDGFRLDNAHSTPIHVCQYLLNIARNQNDRLFVMAELFTNSAEIDADFVQKLNINGLIRELQNSYSPKQLGDYFHQLTCRDAVLGLIDTTYEDLQGKEYKILQPKKPNEIIYDITHDNPTYLKKFNSARLALPMMGLNSMADQAIASTWGVDYLLPEQLDVVTEKRRYHAEDQSDILNGQQSQRIRQLEDQYPHSQEQSASHVYIQKFELKDNGAKKVFLAGSFNDWKPNIEMQKVGYDTFQYEMEFPIIYGEHLEHQYKFVVDGQWKHLDNLNSKNDGHGGRNNYFVIEQNSPQKRSEPTLSPSKSQEKILPDIRFARRILNEIHEISNLNNAEIFLHQQSDDIIVVIRQFELDFSQFDAIVSITRFSYNDSAPYQNKQVIELPGKLIEVLLVGYLEIPQDTYRDFYNDKQFIKGAKANFKIFNDLSKFCNVTSKPNEPYKDLLNFHNMPPSFTCILKTTHHQRMKEIVKNFQELKNEKTSVISQSLQSTTLTGLNHLLYRCDAEEKDISQGKRGPYGLHNYGQFKYAGLTSFMHIIRQIKLSRDMGHELLNNMREGDWFLEYSRDRLDYMKDELKSIIEILSKTIEMIRELPKSLRPKYGARVIEKIYNSALHQLMKKKIKGTFISDTNDPFLQGLAKGILQVYGKVPSAFFGEFKDTLAAGLPHFSTGYTRCWGRDTFIALRGLFLCTELFEDARNIILYFARTMRHGLIPNLHDQGNNTRFNARDATWFFLQAIKDYIHMSDEGFDFFNQVVPLTFENNEIVTIEDLIQRIMQAHAEGIEFREWNAGPKIDAHMKDQGFNIRIYLDQKTGFLHGGNEFNCGTWMDKMGSSNSNKGIPATPRDGAPIELTAMLFSVVSFLGEANYKGKYKYNGVRTQNGQMTYEIWSELLIQNFEKYYYVPEDKGKDHEFFINPKIVNKRGIYKDVVGSTHQYTDYQLRPNLCVAMSYAPELFNKKNAQTCLRNVETILMEEGCMGIKTLDPSDKNYRGDYDNQDESQGWNYHQGPEWVWPVGFFLKAKLRFLDYKEKEDAQMDIMRWLVPHMKHIQKDRWESLPELTNSHGKHCPHSCTAQAWSISTLIDAIRDLSLFEVI